LSLTNEAPSPLQRHFDHLAPCYYEFVDRIWYEFGYYHHAELEFLKTALKEKTRISVDAGCGPGRHSVALAAGANRVVAIDISRRMLQVARENLARPFQDRVDFVQGDVRSLPIKSEVADLVVNFEVLEHLADGRTGILAAFHEFRRVLSDQGRLITEAPLILHRFLSGFIAGSRKEFSEEELQSNYRDVPLPFAGAYLETEIDTLLRTTGFVPVRKKYVRVVPAGLVERIADLNKIDSILETIPIVRRFAREVIWLAKTTPDEIR